MVLAAPNGWSDVLTPVQFLRGFTRLKARLGFALTILQSNFYALKVYVELIAGLRYKLRMMGVPLDGPARVDNQSMVSNTTMPESVLGVPETHLCLTRKFRKSNSIAFHLSREAVAGKWIKVGKEHTDTNLAECLRSGSKKKDLSQPGFVLAFGDGIWVSLRFCCLATVVSGTSSCQ
jgi:hypothetical protein